MERIKKKLDYKWVIVAICFMMEFVCLGFCSSNKGIYLGAIANANFNGNRFLLSFNDTIRFTVSSAINFFFGALILKFGARKMTAFGFTALLGAILCYAYADTLVVFYIGGALLGIGLAFTTTAMVSFIVRNWITENTGSVLGFVLASNGLGGALAAQIVTPIIASGTFGYRNAYKLVALILVVVGTISVIFLRDKPKGSTVTNPPKAKKKPRGGGWIGMEFKDAVKRPYFILSCVIIFLTGLMLSGINGIGSTMLKDDIGLEPEFVATVMTAHSLALMLFKFLAGVIYDRKGLRCMLTICEVAAVIIYVCLALVTNSPTGKVLAMIWGIFSSLALPMETIGVSLFTSDLYGNKAFEKMLGLMMALNHLGYAVGSPVMNLSWELAGGSYVPAILAGAALMTVVVIGNQFLISAAHKDRKAIEASATAE